MELKLSDDRAYMAMFAFLEHQYELSASDDIGALLGAMSILQDGSTADPAIAEDWSNALSKAERGDVDIGLRLGKA